MKIMVDFVRMSSPLSIAHLRSKKLDNLANLLPIGLYLTKSDGNGNPVVEQASDMVGRAPFECSEDGNRSNYYCVEKISHLFYQQYPCKYSCRQGRGLLL